MGSNVMQNSTAASSIMLYNTRSRRAALVPLDIWLGDPVQTHWATVYRAQKGGGTGGQAVEVDGYGVLEVVWAHWWRNSGGCCCLKMINVDWPERSRWYREVPIFGADWHRLSTQALCRKLKYKLLLHLGKGKSISVHPITQHNSVLFRQQIVSRSRRMFYGLVPIDGG